MKSAGKTRVGVMGASGYTGEELVRLLLRHPQAELTAVTSRQFAGKSIAEVFPRTSLHSAAHAVRFSEPSPEKLAAEAGVVFLALPHGVAVEFGPPLLGLGARVIDLSADFRIRD